MVERALSAFGRLDIAFNNAGIHRINIPLADVDEATWTSDRHESQGVFLCMKHEIPAMLTAGGVPSLTRRPSAAWSRSPAQSYIASKHGVLESLARCIGLYLQGNPDQLRASRSEDTAMLQDWLGDPAVAERIKQQHPIGRFAQADEIARAVLSWRRMMHPSLSAIRCW